MINFLASFVLGILLGSFYGLHQRSILNKLKDVKPKPVPPAGVTPGLYKAPAPTGQVQANTNKGVVTPKTPALMEFENRSEQEKEALGWGVTKNE